MLSIISFFFEVEAPKAAAPAAGTVPEPTPELGAGMTRPDPFYGFDLDPQPGGPFHLLSFPP